MKIILKRALFYLFRDILAFKEERRVKCSAMYHKKLTENARTSKIGENYFLPSCLGHEIAKGLFGLEVKS